MSQSISVPATSANLGCLFDSGGLALGLYLHLRATLGESSGISVSGRNADRISTGPDNLIARVMRETLGEWRVEKSFELEIENQIPVGAGLGSSAAAIVGGLALAYRLAGRAPSDEEIVARATRIEGHPDNVAAAWHGGFTISMQEGESVRVATCPAPDSIEFVLVVPDYALSTEKARSVLPQQYARSDAIHNLQRAVFVAAQFFSGRPSLAPAMFDDRMHQPYRAGLMPGLAEVLAFRHPDLLGVSLSGAGPSVLAIARAEGRALGDAIVARFARKGVAAKGYVLAPDNSGAKGRWQKGSSLNPTHGAA